MQLIIYLLTCITGLCISYEDFRYRAVSWILFPVLAFLGFLFSIYMNSPVQTILGNALINTFIIITQLALLKLFFILCRPADAALSGKIGEGDIYLIGATVFFFSPVNFILFLVSSLIFTLVAHLLFAKASLYTTSVKTIPLAGFQSFFIILCITYGLIFKLNLTDDSWLYNLYTL
jgi:hypothetical protein